MVLDFLWDLHQSRRIGDVTLKARDAQSKADDVEARLESLSLATMAMWSLLSERLGVTEAELAERVREIDLRDGRLDGRVGAGPRTCPKCGRSMSARHGHCIYCGGPRTGPVTPFGPG